jgi:predicted nucleotidyltransferase
MISKSKIDEITNKIATNFNPEKIILFGSYAADNQNYDSDLDFLIIKESELPRYKRSFEIRKFLIGSMVPMDIIVYTQQEFDSEKDVKYTFINNAMKTSKLLYERSSQ